MAKKSCFDDALPEVGAGDFDDETDIPNIDQLVLERTVSDPLVQITATISEDHVSFIQCNRASPEESCHCYVDTTDPEFILNALERHIADGGWRKVVQFFQRDGRTISDPVTFRLKFDAVMNEA